MRVDLPGVGKNLQDRYEVSVVNRMREDWNFMAAPKFAKATAVFANGRNRAKECYATNGGMFAVIKKSRQDRRLPDLFCLGLLASFEGYFPAIQN